MRELESHRPEAALAEEAIVCTVEPGYPHKIALKPKCKNSCENSYITEKYTPPGRCTPFSMGVRVCGVEVGFFSMWVWVVP